jgi:hypothetical protein
VSQRHGGGPGAGDQRGRRPVRHPPDVAHTVTTCPPDLRSRIANVCVPRLPGRAGFLRAKGK